ncbi:hypothetical protein DICVIV_09677 [Dictyocaulus viviparus]|uniref:FMRFamide-related peptide FLP-18 n=1 Tax=Dictyocaulus viviparus TaxID=29172 RepID=Q0MVT6_DICVI|nr:FMRFamide-related peptide FLP-18 precursor [Dictyocaulus viviparus]KJH44280.1 hypothetical protein DICVIV_09677 [Dictyocaulus viviparus]
MWRVSTAPLILLAVLANAADPEDEVYDLPDEKYTEAMTLLGISPQAQHIYAKRDLNGDMPGVLRFGKRQDIEKKVVPGVLRFGKRANKKSVPGVLRFGKRSVPGVLRFGKREMPGVLRFGKRAVPGMLRFGKRFGERSTYDVLPIELLDKKSVPGVLRFGK